jgi:hypothetical protein
MAPLAARQRDAEEVRSHLVALRGGAPFLSPTDSALLVGWLDQGVSVAAICVALERAVEARRKRPTRAPLGLTHARRHLAAVQRASAASPPATPTGHPLDPIASALRRDRPPGGEALALALRALPSDEPSALLDEALRLVRRWHEGRWAGLTDAERAPRLAAAREALGDLAADPEDPAIHAAVEERARDALRAETPYLDAPTLWTLVSR